MNAQSSYLLAAGVMVLAGIGIPVGAALNAGLGKTLESPVGASAVLYGVGFLLALVVVGFAGLPDLTRLSVTSPQTYGGATFFLFYVLAITFLAPRIGVGNAVFFVLLGQIVSSAAIDHFGLLGAIREPIGTRRGLGLLVMALGVWLARKPL